MYDVYYSFDDCLFASKELVEQLFFGKRIPYDTFVADESERVGYVAKFFEETLEIYVPENVPLDGVALDDVGELIPEEFRYRVKTVVFGNRIKDISSCNFERFGNIENVCLGDDVETILAGSFYANFRLVKFSVGSNNKCFSVCDGNLYSYDMKKLIAYAPGKVAAFYEVPQCVEVIGNNAFLGANNLRSVKVGSNVRVIEECAFFDAEGLQHIYIDKNVKEIRSAYIFGSHDDMQIYRCSDYLVVGGELDSEIARWCDQHCVNFHVIAKEEMEDFLVMSVCDETFDGRDRYQESAVKETERKRKAQAAARKKHNQEVFEKWMREHPEFQH